jgi:hypothetical protein
MVVLGGAFFGAVAAAWVLYRVSLYYQLETERALREAAKAADELSK